MTRLGIIEENLFLREELRYYFNSQLDFVCTLSAGSVEEFVEVLPDAPAMEIILSNIMLPGKSGLDGIRLIKARQPQAQIILITVYEEVEWLLKALCAGASGFLAKGSTPASIRAALEAFRDGHFPLAPAVAKSLMVLFDPAAVAALRLPQPQRDVLEELRQELAHDGVAPAADMLQRHLHQVRGRLSGARRAAARAQAVQAR